MHSQGYKVAIVTYDQRRDIARFAKKFNLQFALLSDPKSKIIRAFGILDNTYKKRSYAYGVAHPIIFVIDSNGIIRFRFSESYYVSRPDPSQIIKAIKGVR